MIKKVLIWIGTVFVAIFTVLFVKDCRVEHGNDIGYSDDKTEDINAKAAKKRDEAIARIEHADARTIAESYGTVCDTIADGKSRFRKRCGRADD